MKVGDKVKHKYCMSPPNIGLDEGTVVSMIDKSINPYNVTVKWESNPEIRWSKFPMGNYKEEHLEVIK